MSRPTSCPEPAVLSELADDAARHPSAARHAAECPRCAAVVAADRLLAGAIANNTCPDAETLAAFVDETLPPERLDRTAAHVLACEPCREVVGWIREAYAAGQDREESRRRRGRRRPLRARGQGLEVWLPALAAAAAILVIVAFALRGGGPESRRDTLARRESPTRPQPEQPRRERPDERRIPEPIEPEARANPVEPEDALPREAAAGEEVDEQPVEVEPLDLASSRDPAQPEPSDPRPEPATSERAAEPVPEVGVALAAATPGAQSTLLWEHGGEQRPLGERRELPVGARITGAGALLMAGAECTLAAEAEVAVRPDGLELVRGALAVEASPEATLVVARGPARVLPGAEGGLYQAAIAPNRRLTLLVIDGAAELAVGDARHPLAAGEGREVDGERVRPLPGAAELALAGARAHGLELPRGLATAGALAVAARELTAGDLAARARAAWTIEAARTDPRLASAAEAHADAALAALAALEREDPAALAASGAAAHVILARALTITKPGAAPEPLSAIVEALAARPAAELAADADLLLALRAGARLTGARPPRDLWAGVAAALRPDGPIHDLARALLVHQRADPALARSALEALDAALAQDPERAALDPRRLARIELACALADAWTPARVERVSVHAAFATREPALARALAHAGGRALGLKAPALPPASRVARPLRDGSFRVTFAVRSNRRPRAVALYGSWNEWSEQAAVPMRRLPDGRFVATLTLPAGRYAYKLRLEGGRTWEVDGDNPLREADGRGGENSVLVLE